jgi:hypothetical protein
MAMLGGEISRVDSMMLMLGGVEQENTIGRMPFRARLLECSMKAQYHPQAEVHFSHVTKQKLQPMSGKDQCLRQSSVSRVQYVRAQGH